MDDLNEEALLGAPLPDEPCRRAELRAELLTLWEAQHGALGDLETDLTSTRALFNPVSKSKTVRDALAAIAPPASPIAVAASPLVEAGPDDLILVSPEGRVAIDLLAAQPGPNAVLQASHRLLALYRTMSRHRLDQVTRDRSDTGKPAQTPAIGLLILLLHNGHVGEVSALQRGVADAGIEAAVARVVEAFAAVVAPTGRRRRQAGPRRLGSWELGELTRRKDHIIFRDRERLFIIDGGDRQAADAAGSLLARRKGLTSSKLTEGLDALTAAAAREAALLQPQGWPAGDPDRHRRVREAVLDAFATARAERSD